MTCLGINTAQASLRIGTVNMLVRNPEEEKKEKEKVTGFVKLFTVTWIIESSLNDCGGRWRSRSRTAKRAGTTTLWGTARSSPSISISYIRPSGETHVFSVRIKIGTNQKHLGNLQRPPQLHHHGGLQALQGRCHWPRDFLWEHHLRYRRHNYIDQAHPLSECEKTEETLMTSWYPAVTAVFNDKTITKVSSAQTWSWYQALTTKGTEGRAPSKLLQLRLCLAFHTGVNHHPTTRIRNSSSSSSVLHVTKIPPLSSWQKIRIAISREPRVIS